MDDIKIKKELSNEEIKKLIYTVRGKQVMLDSDVAMLYHYETKNINKAMKRNIERFPEDFCFRLTEEEINSLRFQFGTLKKNQEDEMFFKSQMTTLKNSGRGQHRKYLPYVFTEQGIAMLSGLLKNEIAVKVSINIMNAFVEMRKFNKEYPILKIVKSNKFHDRFIIIDEKELYHCGASLKDLGKKCFGINKIEDLEYINRLNSIV